MNKPITVLAAAIFAIMAIIHVLRLVFGWQATINGVSVPMWASIVFAVVAGALAAGLLRESRR